MLSFLSHEWLKLDLRTLSKVLLNSFLIFLGVGFYVPYITEALHKLGFSDAFIGLSISIELTGFVIGALFLNKLLQRSLHRIIYFCALILMTLILGTLPIVVHSIFIKHLFPHLLLIIRFFFGLSAAYIYILHDSMISHFAARISHKTALMGVYFTSSSIGLIMGSLCHDAVDQFEIISFVTCFLSILIFLGCCFLTFSPKFLSLFTPPTKKGTLFDPFKILFSLPLLIFIATAYALGGKVTTDLLDVYAQQSDVAATDTTFLLSVLIVGSLLLPPLLGNIADKIKLHKAIILFCALLSIAYSLIFFMGNSLHLIWPVFFFIGGMYAIFDGLGLTYASSRLAGTLLISGCMAVEISESLAGAFLSPLIGDSMSYLGPKGFSGGILVLYLLLLFIFLFSYKKDQKEKKIS